MIMLERLLYQDQQIKIGYLPYSAIDHILFIREGETGEFREYLIQRGILKELATTPRGGIEQKIANFNERILSSIKKVGIKIDGLHVALCQAYQEEESRYYAATKIGMIPLENVPSEKV